jgi:hypothetical protein
LPFSSFRRSRGGLPVAIHTFCRLSSNALLRRGNFFDKPAHALGCVNSPRHNRCASQLRHHGGPAQRPPITRIRA